MKESLFDDNNKSYDVGFQKNIGQTNQTLVIKDETQRMKESKKMLNNLIRIWLGH